MLQRIQSIYLLLIIISVSLMFVTDLCTIMVGDSIITFNAMGITENATNFQVATTPVNIVMGLSILVIFITLFSIAKYKNRTVQIKLCRMNMLFILGLLLAIFYGADSIQSSILSQQPNATTEYKANLGTLFPILSIILNLLANKAIKKDIARVRSANRIR